MSASILLSVLFVAVTDVALQLDNAIAITSVAASVPRSQRIFVLAGGVLLAAICLFTFTLVGTTLIEKLAWLKPVAGLALILIGGHLLLGWFRS